jgi:hypothetical protein
VAIERLQSSGINVVASAEVHRPIEK